MQEDGKTVWFLFAEVLLYLAFLIADIQDAFPVSVGLKYCAILLCLVLVWTRTASGGERLVFFALLLTATADFFLLVLGQYLICGLLLFICVQALYAWRIHLDTATTGLLRCIVPLVVWFSLWRMELMSMEYLLAGLYFPQLVCNAVLAWRLPSPWGRLFALGLILFVGCDVCVGLWNLPGIPEAVEQLAGYGMWLFYLPSQVLIVLSARTASVQREMSE